MSLGFTPLLGTRSITPIYMQLYHYIRSQIENGAIAEGNRLPSIRQLAQHLSISKNTVESAYQQLLAEGYIQSRERNGYLVLPLDELSISMKSAAAEPLFENTEATSRQYAYDFQYGDVELNRFPLETWKRCLVETLSAADAQVLGYGNRLGHEGLRAEIANLVFQSRGVACHPDQIIISAGTQQAVSMLCQLLPLRGTAVGMEDPGYHGVRTVLINHGCKLTPIALEQDGIRLDSLRAADVKAVYVTPSHQFPLGMVLPIQKRIHLLQWAEENGTYIIEDDYDSEFRYYSQPIPSLKALDKQERVIYLGTFSKSFLPAARLSYMIIPPELMRSIHQWLQDYNQPVSPIIQQAVWLFMKNGEYARHVRKMRRLYQMKHKALTAAVSKHMGDKATIIGDGSGLHILLDVKGKSRSWLIERGEQSGCKVYSPLKHWLYPAQCPESLVMLGFGGLSVEEIETGIELLGKAWFSH
ncbi:PLP-dependent aminotransferase family protein [Paenibacillus harenae]|uniref:MocR-like pyridoxine biosynthesis transcription factor PdxR n=1 Tax=Paenibacillus harenae TaxID=306543 RepID=UPI0003F5A5B9|nr:PLP-dependent aminotransferase family protein [Paenibacillus harenae]